MSLFSPPYKEYPFLNSPSLLPSPFPILLSQRSPVHVPPSFFSSPRAQLQATPESPSRANIKTPSKATVKTPSKATVKTPSKATVKTPSRNIVNIAAQAAALISNEKESTGDTGDESLPQSTSKPKLSERTSRRRETARVAAQQRRKVKKNQRQKLTPTWLRLPPISSSTAPPGTIAARWQRLANQLHGNVKEPFTSIRVKNTWEEVMESKLNGKVRALDELQTKLENDRAIGHAYRVFPLQVGTDEDEAHFQYHVKRQMLPLIITGALEPQKLLASKTFLLKCRTEGVKCVAKSGARIEVQDGAKADPKGDSDALRLSNFDELDGVLGGTETPTHPLNWLDITNYTSTRMTPDLVLTVSLEAKLMEKRGNAAWIPQEFLLASTQGATSTYHVDAMGQLTWLRPIEGEKTWYMPDCHPDDAVDLYQSKFSDHVLPPRMRPFGVNINSGEAGVSCWLQGPGQVHAVYTSTRLAFFVGGFLYTAASMAMSIRQIRRELCERAMSNEDPTAASFQLLTGIVRELLDDNNIFDGDQRADVAFELNRLVDDWQSVDRSQTNEMLGWYFAEAKRAGKACEKFMEVADKWQKRFYKRYNG